LEIGLRLVDAVDREEEEAGQDLDPVLDYQLLVLAPAVVGGSELADLPLHHRPLEGEVSAPELQRQEDLGLLIQNPRAAIHPVLH